MAALQSNNEQKKMVNSSINVDDLCKKSTEYMSNKIKNIYDAADLFKTEIKKDFLKKLQISVERNYRKTFLFIWRANKKPDNCNEEDEIYYKTFNNMKPFDIMNNYKKSQGKYQFMKELSQEINEEFGTKTTKFYIKYEKLYDNKYVITSKFYIPKADKVKTKSNIDQNIKMSVNNVLSKKTQQINENSEEEDEEIDIENINEEE